MDYQKLFDLMSEHGLTLLEGEMDEIIETVNEIQQPLKEQGERSGVKYYINASSWNEETFCVYILDNDNRFQTIVVSGNNEKDTENYAKSILDKLNEKDN